MPQVELLIIHLERAAERRAHVDGLIKHWPHKAVLIDAVDSYKLKAQDIAQHYQRQLIQPSYPFALSHNEIACFLSHRKAWHYIVDHKLDCACVIEDDVELLDGFDEAIELACQHIKEHGFIRFPFRFREEGKTIAKSGQYQLIKPQPVGLGQVAQLISYHAAQKLLQATQVFDRPVDTYLQMFWQTGLYPLSLVPPVVREISAMMGGTTVQKKNRQFFSRLKREIARPLYRKKIASLSRKYGNS